MKYVKTVTLDVDQFDGAEATAKRYGLVANDDAKTQTYSYFDDDGNETVIKIGTWIVEDGEYAYFFDTREEVDAFAREKQYDPDLPKLSDILQGIYDWTISGDKIVPPKQNFPKAVMDRIRWAAKEIDNGLTFMGVLEAVFSENEEKAQENWEIGAAQPWLPVSDEFKEWRDDYTGNSKQLAVAVALIYGWGGENLD